MYLVIDIGNTEVKTCLVKKNFKIQKKSIIKTKLLTNKIIFKQFSFLKKEYIKRAIISSVVPDAHKKIKYILKKLKIKNKELKNYNIKKLIKIKLNLKQVGSDRIANAISVNQNKNNYVIIDFGTATTFDIVTKNQYLGGVIAPGVKLSLSTLISNASLIPKLKLSKINKVIGKNTKSAVRSGFFWGYLGLIEKILKLIITKTRKKFKIVMTGGYSHLFKKSLMVKSTLDKDLTIKGLIKVLKCYEK